MQLLISSGWSPLAREVVGLSPSLLSFLRQTQLQHPTATATGVRTEEQRWSRFARPMDCLSLAKN